VGRRKSEIPQRLLEKGIRKITMHERVDVVMATYNGMPYICEQLQSILW